MVVTWVMRTYQWERRADRENFGKEVIYTLGDAISSFMRKEDESTKNICLATKDDFASKWTMKDLLARKKHPGVEDPRQANNGPIPWWKALCCTVEDGLSGEIRTPSEEPRPWNNRPTGWWRAASIRRRILLIGA